jgi:acetyl-CoA synthetase
MSDQDRYAWQPDARTVAQANLTRFIRALGAADYDELLRRADAEPEWFYDGLLKHLDYRFYKPYEHALDESKGAPWTRWCVGSTTNVVLNAIDRWRGTPVYDKQALAWDGEDGAQASFTYREMDREVCRCAGALRSLGLGRGDVIALYLPMTRNLKIMRRVIRAACLGENPGDLSSLVNPEAVEEIRRKASAS